MTDHNPQLDPAQEVDARPARWAARLDSLTLTAAQADGFECIAGCGYDQLRDRDPDRPMVPVGFGPKGQVFACCKCDNDEFHRQAAQAEIDRAKAEQEDEEAEAGLALLRGNILDSIAASGMDVPQVANRAGLGVHYLTAVLAGREVPTVRDLLLLGYALNTLAGDWLPALDIDAPEVSR